MRRVGNIRLHITICENISGINFVVRGLVKYLMFIQLRMRSNLKGNLIRIAITEYIMKYKDLLD
jgi:hypothetical protein